MSHYENLSKKICLVENLDFAVITSRLEKSLYKGKTKILLPRLLSPPASHMNRLERENEF